MRLAGAVGQGIEATLVELYPIPFDGDAIVTLGQENHGRMLMLEDNYGGGFGSAVADALVEYSGLSTVKQMGVWRIPNPALYRMPSCVIWGYLWKIL